MKRIKAGGGVVYRTGESEEPEVLMIRRRGVWDLPKGKQDPDEAIEECALREVTEETGVPVPEMQGFVVSTRHTYSRDNEEILKDTDWYAMRLSGHQYPLTPQLEEEIELVVWVPLAEAKQKVGFDNLVKVLERFEAFIENLPDRSN